MPLDFPNSPTVGMTFPGPGGVTWTWDGVKWVGGGGSGGGGSSSVVVSPTPPASPTVGQLWWDSTGGQLYIRYEDPNTQQWVTTHNIGFGSPINVANGGTGIVTYSQGDLIYGSAPDTLARLTKSTAATRYLANTGASNNPAWDQVNLTNGVTGILPIANGGTGAATAGAAPWVEVGGDTMTGALAISPPSGQAVLLLNKSASGLGALIYGQTAGSTRWTLLLGDLSTETGSNAGSNFAIQRYNDAGTIIDTPLAINRSNGVIGVSSTAFLNGSAGQMQIASGRITFKQAAGQEINAGTIDYGGFGASLYIVGYGTAAGNRAVAIVDNLAVQGTILSDAGVTVSRIASGGPGFGLGGFQNAGVFYGTLTNGVALNSGGNASIRLGSVSDATIKHLCTQHQFVSTNDSATYAIFNAGGTYNVSGAWQTLSDASTKTNVQPYGTGLATVVQLAPVTFQYISEGDSAPTRIGLIAQDVQAVIPEVVGSMEIDGETKLTLESGNLIYAIINSLREVDERLKALEGAL